MEGESVFPEMSIFVPNFQHSTFNTMNVSTFNGMTSKQPQTATLEEVVELIRSDTRLESITRAYRQTGSKTFKREAPLFAVAVRFEGGKGREHITALTGLSLVDFDHIGDTAADILRLKEQIAADPHTLLCYTTISGQGLRVIFRYEVPQPETLNIQHSTLYLSAFLTGNAYYERLTGLKADQKCKNITRLSGTAHDAEVFLNGEAVAFTAEEMTASAAAHARQSKTERQMQRIQNYFDAFVAPQLAKAGVAFQPGRHNDYVMRVGYKLAERGFSRAVAVRWAVSRFGGDYPETEQVVTSCFANAGPKGRAKDGEESRQATVEDIKAFLDGHVSLRCNEITARVEYLSDAEDGETWLPINDRKVNSLWAELSRAMRVNKLDLYSIIESDYVPLFNPFRDYLERLEAFNTQPSTLDPPPSTLDPPPSPDYIRALADTVRVKGGEAEQQRWQTYLRKWLVAMVASWISDEVVNNVILVLIGEQGSFKTTWFNYLLPPELKQYFYTKTNANRMTKDDLLTLAQYALVCCEELDTMRPAELNQLKAAVTMPSIDERAAYAHFHEHRRHIASFCGTGNNTQFLSDPTGNRRWLPFEVDYIRSPRDRPFPYAGIYSQALALYKSGFQFWFSREEIQELNSHNRQFETPRLEHELVALYFRVPTEGENGMFMTSARAIQIIGCGISQKLSAVNVGRAFVDLGFQRVRTKNCRGFIVVQRTGDEIKAYQHSILIGAEGDR